MPGEAQLPSPTRVPPPEPDPMAAMKLTRGTSCVLCQQRKVRCDKNKPCANCVKARVECRVIPPQPPRRRKKRLQERDLVDRLKKYENLLAENGVKFDPIAADLKASDRNSVHMDDDHQIDDDADLANDFEGLKTSPEGSTSPSVAGSRRSQSDKPFNKWFPFHKEFRASEELLRDSSEDEVDGSTIHHAFDKMYDNQDGFPFVVGSRNASVMHLHPSPIQIFQLWQIYINNVNPLLKITHVPTVQGLIIEASANLEKIPKNVESLMFAIYLMAVTSLEDVEVAKMFNEPKPTVLSRFHTGLQQALVNAGFMRTSDTMVLQAYMLYLIGVRMFVDPRQIFCLVGIAVRIAQRMGLHRDAAAFGLSPYEVEQRRRLWWTIVGYDRRIGEMTGSTVTALSTAGDCKLPLNINDTDLHVNGKDAPTPHQGVTEMLFVLIRTELAMAINIDSMRDPQRHSDKDGALGSAAPRPGPTVRMAGQDQSYTLDGFFAHIEGTYLKWCDPKIPLHFFTLTMTRQALCKMRVISFLVRMGNGEASTLADHERDTLFLEAIQMIEYDNIVQAADSLQGYKWYTYLHFPFPAYMFLVTELRHRLTGPMVERAWDAIAENHERRGLMSTLHSPMHIAFGNLFIKAWDAHEAGQQQIGKPMQEPMWITRLRQRAERMGKKQRSGQTGAEMGAGIPQQTARAVPVNSTSQLGAMQMTQNIMMTPPSVGAGTPAMSGPPAPESDVVDMDWSYLMQGYDMDTYVAFGGGFGGFPLNGNNIGGPGMMGNSDGNMFGN
ncbi:fungal specific transcription factor domain-containing protein [Colletotrichum graminicola]|uniref:Fungal specific transcription factor domain-containing protein n=1 Tax=Colletotrichum graminicola (strain M1.001 / M2 / FGSC 10212) TaxID=645133 RepID=E3QQM9_COLGM|nr:fungal specific transcription factor domain-containing protein [Colletotrichum graminicola M1.001]EFQ33167.1 fungal specific transcription factor domain-containing protein [Colletotrichum graminicola M1.001]WDK17510.1 fungal specific transcription factor domain-containing protein [Colletotrichum graminicola]